eukprot:CAMPEP_0176105636 /NCGR_PEP_ID=MMETSP0120_2-20121206/53010_1 /TAXON_ID=160619 /ORGANISM="Kryptoperidinium foliaceum, Strain CCMP 1326" /LENGTH=777 /DNA_ID=CAMNT_0017439753 /DNA_START=35 /DNA_END=2368 /DNA_ORIENTATION=-
MAASSTLRVAAFAALIVSRGALGAEQQVAQHRSLEAVRLHSGLQASDTKEYQSPVQRVRKLLQKMKSELDAEADKESELYDKMVCWCETNEKEKKKAVADAEAKDKELTSEIEARSARFGTLAAEIENTKKEVRSNKEALKTARSIRESEADKFRQEEKDMVQAITNLRNAIAVLEKHQNTQALMQIDKSVLSGMRVLLRDAALKYEVLVAGREEQRGADRSVLLVSMKEKTRRVAAADTSGITGALLSALDAHNGDMVDVLPLKFAARLVESAAKRPSPKSFLQVTAEQPLYESRSSSRSAGIFGIMTQMLDEFQAELKTMQAEETQAVEGFEELSAAKEDEIEAGKKKLDEMQGDDAGNAKALSDAKEDLAIIRKQRSEDIKFLQNLKVQCNDLDAQWEKRRETRTAETRAVQEAIVILSEDDHRETVERSISMLQTSAAMGAKRTSAAALLRRMADAPDFEADDLLSAWHSRRSGAAPLVGAAGGPKAQLSALAVAVQMDSFGKVIKMIDTMHGELKEQQAEEAKFKAYCQKELKDNEKTTYKKSELKKDLVANIDRLKSLVKKLREEIEAAKDQIGVLGVEIKKASQTREEENAEFQTIVKDQRATQTILKKALQKLKDFYEKGMGSKVALAQQEPPVKFTAYKKNEGASPVMGLIEQILEDSARLEAEATEGETRAQKEYEKLVADSNEMIKGLKEEVTAKTKAISAADADKAQASEDLENTEAELESLEAYAADLHGQCDFVLKNFDIRQKARLQEMEAIHSAKAILRGAK